VNAVGYCIAGTTLSLTLALMAQRGDDRVNSATFFTTLTDFSDQGEFTPFLQDDFVEGIEAEVAPASERQLMTRTLSFLRANDLVWGPAIRSYMLGEAPPAFDLLFWNGDGTNLPGGWRSNICAGCASRTCWWREGFEVLGTRSLCGRQAAALRHRLRDRSHRAVEIQLARRGADGIEGQDLHPVGIGPYRRDRQPAQQEEIRPLHQ
jgi:hypothetical protein